MFFPAGSQCIYCNKEAAHGEGQMVSTADIPKQKQQIVESDDEDNADIEVVKKSSDNDSTDEEDDDHTVLHATPPAPPLLSTSIPVVTARVKGIHPPPERAYLLGDDILVCLGKVRGNRMLQLRKCVQKGKKFHAHEEKKAHLDAMQVKNLQ